MKILITGGAGFIGSHIAKEFLKAGDEVLVIDNLSTGHIENIPEGCFFEKIDITDEQQLKSILQWRPDVISHQAAQASLLSSYIDPAFDAKTNIIGTINMINYAKWNRVKIFTFASTSAVFSNDTVLINETMQPNPERPYGISKYAAEMYVKHSGLNYAILRYANVYGPVQFPIGENQLIARLFGHIYFEDEFSIYGDGEHRRDLIYVDDVAEANYVAVKENMNGVFCVGTGHSVSVNEVVNEIIKITGIRERIKHSDPIDEPRNIIITPMNWNGKWKAKTKLIDGLKKTDLFWKEMKNAF